jgi:hypothetical protein
MMTVAVKSGDLASDLLTLDGEICNCLKDLGSSSHKDAFLLATTSQEAELMIINCTHEAARSIATKLRTEDRPLLADPTGNFNVDPKKILADARSLLDQVDANLKVARLASQRSLENLVSNNPVLKQLSERRAALLDQIYPDRKK